MVCYGERRGLPAPTQMSGHESLCYVVPAQASPSFNHTRRGLRDRAAIGRGWAKCPFEDEEESEDEDDFWVKIPVSF